MDLRPLITAKRDGRPLTESQSETFAHALTDPTTAPEQIAALAMAIRMGGMDAAETAGLTRAFIASGQSMAWPDLPGPVLDKHSTGGVGDKTSLIVAPIIAACGGYVPMISGRGLGHTGGTLDKLASIPGYDPFPGLDRFRAVMRETGCAIIGQTGELAPADGRLYAIRDLTATIDSLPLITASILSKKAAAGVRGLVMDIKTGSGAFMATLEQASSLGQALIAAAEELGIACTALVTDMDQVLGRSAGNALEVCEAIAVLTGGGHSRLRTLSLRLAQEMLTLGGLDPAKAERALASGAAAGHFARMVAALGGPADLLERPDAHLPAAPVTLAAYPPEPGYLATMDVRAIGEMIVALGGGRIRADAAIDPRVGLSETASPGEPVGPGAPIAIVHAASRADAELGVAQLIAACIVAPDKPAPETLIRATLGAERIAE